MIGEALAVAARRVDSAVLARTGGSIGVRARAARGELERLDPDAQRRTRIEWAASARSPVPAGVRGVHPSWIEHALEGLPARARAAVAGGVATGATIDVWLARWVTAELVTMPATRPGPPRVPDDAALLEAPALLAWLERIGCDQLAYALGDAAAQLGDALRAAVARIGVAPRLGQLGPVRAAVLRCAGHDAVEIGARAIAPYVSAEVRRQAVARLPRSVGLRVARALREHAAAPVAHGPSWPALVA